MIECGWCGRATANDDRCTSCGHDSPRKPWEQRGQTPPAVAVQAGRPTVTDAEIRLRLAAVPGGTDEQLAEHFDVDPRTVRRWRAKVSG